jgi:LPS sulfotransferase NodH
VAYDAHDACYDRPAGSPTVEVTRSLLLCSSPRSGSTLLADALHRSDRLGCPTEYFDPTAAFAACSSRWGTTDMRSYVAALHRFRTTDEGLLSAKIHWFQLQWLCRELAPSLTVGTGARALERAVLELVFPRCRYVRVVRRDRDRQAVSWAIADQLDRWVHDDPRSTATSADFAYDFDAIDDFRRRLDDDEAQWDALLAALGVDVLTVAYEDLLRSYTETVTAVAAHAGVDLAPDEVAPPRLERQADQHSEQVLALYRRDRRRRSPT